MGESDVLGMMGEVNGWVRWCWPLPRGGDGRRVDLGMGYLTGRRKAPPQSVKVIRADSTRRTPSTERGIYPDAARCASSIPPQQLPSRSHRAPISPTRRISHPNHTAIYGGRRQNRPSTLARLSLDVPSTIPRKCKGLVVPTLVGLVGVAEKAPYFAHRGLLTLCL